MSEQEDRPMSVGHISSGDQIEMNPLGQTEILWLLVLDTG